MGGDHEFVAGGALGGAVILLTRYTTGDKLPWHLLYGIRHCPECGIDFEPSPMAINFGKTRYEKCPHCRKWLWTKWSSNKQSSTHFHSADDS